MNKSGCLNRSVGLFCAIIWIFFSGKVIVAQQSVGDLEVQSGHVELLRGNTTFIIGKAERTAKLYQGDILTASNSARAAVYIESWMEILTPGSSWTVPKPPVVSNTPHSKVSLFLGAIFRWNPREDKDTAVSKGTMSDTTRLNAAFPSHHGTILTDRPYFIWNRSKSVYEITIYHEETVIFKKTAKNAHYLAFPDNIGALRSNLNYYWEVVDSFEPRFNDSSVFTVATNSLRREITDEVKLLRTRLKNNGYSSDMIAIATAGYLHQKGYDHAAVQEIIQAMQIDRGNRRLNFIINKLIGGIHNVW